MANAFRKRSKLLDVAKNMPPSYHTLPGVEFNIKNSEVINWLIDQPEILNFLWNQIKQSKDVYYDPVTKVWTGVDWDGE